MEPNPMIAAIYQSQTKGRLTLTNVAGHDVKKDIKIANGHELKIEVHIAHFDRSLYGEKLTVFMTDKIRGEKQFQDKAALIDQIKKDCKQLG